MASTKIDEKVMASLKAFATEIRKHYKVESIFLFGSYAKGQQRYGSDIDVAVVTRDKGNRFNDEVKMMELSWGINTDIEPHIIHLDEFENMETIIAHEVKQHGIRVA